MSVLAGDDGAGAPTIKVRPTLARARSPLAAPERQIAALDALELRGEADFGARA